MEQMKGLFIDEDVTRRRKETDVGKQVVLNPTEMRIDFVRWRRHQAP